jgi:hypothetical protein
VFDGEEKAKISWNRVPKGAVIKAHEYDPERTVVLVAPYPTSRLLASFSAETELTILCRWNYTAASSS